jgi:CHAT domain-containing protein
MVTEWNEISICLGEARDLLPEVHPMHTTLRSHSAANMLQQHAYGFNSSPNILDIAFDLLANAVQHPTGPLQERFETSLTWIGEARRLRHESMVQAYSASLNVLTLISLQYPTLELQHKSFLSDFHQIPRSLVPDAVACAIESGRIEKAIEILEQGRAIMWSRMRGFRHPLVKLHDSHPELGTRFKTLSAQLELQATTVQALDASTPGSGPAVSFEVRQRNYQRLTVEWNKVVEEIRNVDGFQDFLRAVRFSSLRRAAAEGPVILLNVSKYRSDAVILVSETEQPALIPLPDFSLTDLAGLTRRFLDARASHSERKLRDVLVDSWEMIVQPVVDHLKSLGVESKSRIWWCPTSQLCALPIHAAGPYSARQKSLPDLYVSSYTPTLSALISSREHMANTPAIPKLLAVGESDHGSIPSVEEELRRIQSLGKFVEILKGESASCENVIRNLKTHSWIHFACHGILNTVPFHSSFKLHDGQHLELLELIKAHLPDAEFAFLSACHAAAVDIEGVPDEVIHLSAALIFCGFRSVVGTLWAMDDEDGPDVAEDFYRYMFRDLESGKVDFREAAMAINLATREMRKKKLPLSRWVNFVHIGA